MPVGRTNHKLARLATAAALGASLVAATAAPARAEGPVVGDGKGIVGGALLGAEVVTITMAVIGIEDAWPYFVFGGAGAVGGGIAGYFIEQSDPPAEAPVFMLVGGMALVIPAVVAALNATAYRPPESDQPDPSTTEPAREAPIGASVTISDARRAPARKAPPPHIPLSAIDLYGGAFGLGVPAVEVRPLYSTREMARFGLEQGAEVRVPVFRASF